MLSSGLFPASEDGTVCSETSEHKIQTPGNNPEESIQHLEHGESLKSRRAVSLDGNMVRLVGERCLTVLVSNHIVAHGIHAACHDVSTTHRLSDLRPCPHNASPNMKTPDVTQH